MTCGACAKIKQLEAALEKAELLLQQAEHSLRYHECRQYGDKPCSNCELQRDLAARSKVEP